MPPSPSRPTPNEAPAEARERPITTVQQHILDEQKRFPGASGEFSWLLSGITLATKMIAARVRRAGLEDVIGVHGSVDAAGSVNVQGEVQQKLDVYANQVLVHCLKVRESVAVLASEENERALLVASGSPSAKYVIVFDPLDGSSNIDVGVSVGTTFSVLKCDPSREVADPVEHVLQPGTEQVAAGYVVYGSSTILVYSVGNGVHGFTLDPSIGAYVLSHENIRIPDQGRYYSVNEAYADTFPPAYKTYIARLRSGLLGREYASRYIGSMVADVHRTLLKGGVFLYPPTASSPDGKLRLMYEANPVAMLVEQAGGVATSGTERILDIQPTTLHQRTPLVVGGKVEMQDFANCMAARPREE